MNSKLILLSNVAVILSAMSLFAEELRTADDYAYARQKYNGEWVYPEGALPSNVYARVRSLYQGHWQTPFDHFLAVRGGGVEQELSTTNFSSFCSFVSNNFESIVADWQVYETNEMVRFTTLSAIGYTGFTHMTNLADRILSEYEADTNYCSWATIRFINLPHGTKANTYYLAMNYELPAVSNLISRIKALAVAHGDDSMRNICDEDLSGESKRHALDLMEIGDWW